MSHSAFQTVRSPAQPFQNIANRVEQTLSGIPCCPARHSQVNARAHASSVLHDKLIVFGGVRDKAGSRSLGKVAIRPLSNSAVKVQNPNPPTSSTLD